jgi:hypothetical protein
MTEVKKNPETEINIKTEMQTETETKSKAETATLTTTTDRKNTTITKTISKKKQESPSFLKQIAHTIGGAAIGPLIIYGSLPMLWGWYPVYSKVAVLAGTMGGWISSYFEHESIRDFIFTFMDKGWSIPHIGDTKPIEYEIIRYEHKWGLTFERKIKVY